MAVFHILEQLLSASATTWLALALGQAWVVQSRMPQAKSSLLHKHAMSPAVQPRSEALSFMLETHFCFEIECQHG